MAELAHSGGFALSADALGAIRADFDAGRADEAETAAEIRDTCAGPASCPTRTPPSASPSPGASSRPTCR